MKKFILLIIVTTAVLMAFGCNNKKDSNNSNGTTNVAPTVDAPASEEAKIQVAILLDTSSSMDGLIDQAKARLWNIVNTLTTLKFNGKTPEIEIALYEYGHNDIPTDDFIRQVAPLTTDLDLISEKLFALTTYGGLEYCGAVIDKSVKELDWGNRPADMKLIYIAGNEPFTQGNIHYKTAIKNALAKNIFVNTIHCGDEKEGIEGLWKDGAATGKGKFFNIDHNVRVRHYDTPYDKDIMRANEQLNDTYISYGVQGEMKKQNQVQQDKNAESVSSANYTERAVSKTKQAYKNDSWDLVDKVKKDAKVLDELAEAELPAELKDKSKEEIKVIVEQKEKERATLQKEIAELAKKRDSYIEEQRKKDADTDGDDLGAAINESVMALAKTMGYTVDNSN